MEIWVGEKVFPIQAQYSSNSTVAGESFRTFELKSVEKIYDFFGEVHYAPGDLYSLVNKILGRLQVSRETIVLIFSDRQLYGDRDSTSFIDIWKRRNK